MTSGNILYFNANTPDHLRETEKNNAELAEHLKTQAYA